MKTESQTSNQVNTPSLYTETDIRILDGKQEKSLPVEYSREVKGVVSLSLMLSSLGIGYYSYRIYKSLI